MDDEMCGQRQACENDHARNQRPACGDGPARDLRHARDHDALSAGETALLATKKVAVVGCGGLGGYAIEALARIGVGNLVLIDGDVFEESNLNRQMLCRACDIGRPKAVRAAEHVGEIDSSIATVPHQAWLDEGNAQQLLEGCDCVVDALDSAHARLVLARACNELGLPLVYGAIAGWYGQVAVVYPGDQLYQTIYGAVEDSTLDVPSGDGGLPAQDAPAQEAPEQDAPAQEAPEQDAPAQEAPAQEALPLEKQLGNLVFTAACTASHQAAEVVKVLIGRGTLMRDDILMIDLLDDSYDTLA